MKYILTILTVLIMSLSAQASTFSPELMEAAKQALLNEAKNRLDKVTEQPVESGQPAVAPVASTPAPAKLPEVKPEVTVVEEKKETVLEKIKPTPEHVDSWSQVGINIGRGLSSVAKETGVAVNEFSRTPVGVITGGLIIYKIMGTEINALVNRIYHVLAAFIVWVIGYFAIKTTFNNAHTRKTWDKDGKLAGIVKDDFGSDATIGYVICNIVIFGAGLLIFIL